MIKLENLSKSYNGCMILDNINFEFENNKIYGLLGKNGIGKTTLFNCISGKINDYTGTIEIDGRRIEGLSYIENPTVLFNSDKIFYKKLTVAQHFELIMLHIDDFSSKDTMTEFNLLGYKDNYPHELSLGTAQRFNLALRSTNMRGILLADEPFNGMDVVEIKNLIKYFNKIKSPSSTIIISSHDIETLRIVCDEVVVIKDCTIQNVDKKLLESRDDIETVI